MSGSRGHKPVNQLLHKTSVYQRTTARSASAGSYRLHSWGDKPIALPELSVSHIPAPKNSPTSTRKEIDWRAIQLSPSLQQPGRRSSSVPSANWDNTEVRDPLSLPESPIPPHLENPPAQQENHNNPENLEDPPDNSNQEESSSESATSEDSDDSEGPQQYIRPVKREDTMNSENFVNPQQFHGTQLEDPEDWWQYVENWFAFKRWTNLPEVSDEASAAEVAAANEEKADAARKVKNFFPLIFKDAAKDWFRTLPSSDRETLDAVRTAFRNRYMPDNDRYKTISDVWHHKQLPNESVDTYYVAIRKLARQAGAEDDPNLKYAFISGLRPDVRKDVVFQNPTTILEAVNVAQRSEQATKMGSWENETSAVEKAMTKLAMSNVSDDRQWEKLRDYGESSDRNRRTSSSPDRNRSRCSSPRFEQPRVHFSDQQQSERQSRSNSYQTNQPGFQRQYSQGTRENTTKPYNRSDSYSRQYPARNRSSSWNGRSFSGQYNNSMGRSYNRGAQNATYNASQQGSMQPASFQRSSTVSHSPNDCRNCGNRHPQGNCPAYGIRCSHCNRFNHFARVCRSAGTNQYHQTQ